MYPHRRQAPDPDPWQGESAWCSPEGEPYRNGNGHADPQTLAHGAADLAHREPVTAELACYHRGRRQHQTKTEDHRDIIEIGAKRSGGMPVRAHPAQHHDVGCRHRDLGKIGENNRPAQREHRDDFITPCTLRHGILSCNHQHCSVFQRKVPLKKAGCAIFRQMLGTTNRVRSKAFQPCNL